MRATMQDYVHYSRHNNTRYQARNIRQLAQAHKQVQVQRKAQQQAQRHEQKQSQDQKQAKNAGCPKARRLPKLLLATALLCVFSLFALVALPMMLEKSSGGILDTQSAPSTQQARSTQSTQDAQQTAQALSSEQIFNIALPVSQLNDTGSVQLVNQEHPLKTIPSSANLQAASSKFDVSSRSIFLDKATLNAAANLNRAAQNAQIGSIVVNSGYRSYSEQAQLYESTSNKSSVQKPGSSEHHTGLALDIEVDTSNGVSSEQGMIWAAEHAWEYGLILRYPENKQNITQITYEPWHFRYVGTPHAWYCWKYQLCLEEYLEDLHKTGAYQVKLNNKTYYVSYQTVQDGVLYVPKSQKYEISNDGCGGYLVTTWE